jgi:Cof subfamily protein (haloacid dehalogenase superfamily)
VSFRAIACDLDGTLLQPDGTLDARTARALADVDRAGLLLVLCTARPHRWVQPLRRFVGRRCVAACANGAVVWDLHGETLVEARTLAPEVTAEVVKLLAQALPGGAWAVERTSGFAHEPGYRPRWPVPHDTVIDHVDVLAARPAVKLMFDHPSLAADALLAHARDVVGHLAEPTHSNSADSLLEIGAAGVSKASALARVCEAQGLSSADVIAFGDMPNDLPMLRWAGHAVAVANAHPDVLGAADEITTGNHDAGVARVLERLLASSVAALDR